MALIKFGGGVAAASGSVAGNVYARNRAGAYIRNWAKPINPATVLQSEVRSAFGSASTSWGELTKTQIDSWNAYAGDLERLNALGEAYTPLGRQIYLEVNSNLQAIGQPMLDTPGPSSTKPSIDALSVVTAVADTGVLTDLAFTDPSVTLPGGGSGHVIIQAAPAHGPEKDNVNNQYRQLAVSQPADVSDITQSEWIAYFGNAVSSGQILDFRMRIVDDLTGLSSAWVKARAIVTEAP